MQIANMRKEYTRGGLLEAEVDADPIRQFQTWFEQALAAQVPEPNAMTLATATPDGQPAARIVLLKAFDAAGFTFYTNYESRKGRELAANPRAALLFFWAELQRQVRIEGTVERVSEVESDEYFRSRPMGSRLAPGHRVRARTSPAATGWKSVCANWRSALGRARCRVRCSGAASASAQSQSSSGRAGRIVFTIDCVICVCETPAGGSNDYRHDRDIAEPLTSQTT